MADNPDPTTGVADPRGFTPWRHEPDEFDREMADDFDEFDEEFDCGMMPNGQCSKAGSEECDWDCPRSRP